MSVREDQAMKLYEEGRQYLYQRKFKQCVLTLQKAMQSFLEVGNLYMYARTVNSLGVTYGMAGNETMAVDCYLSGLDFAAKYHIEGVSHLFNNNIGTRYQDLGDDESALDYFLKAADECSRGDETFQQSKTWYVILFLNIGMSYWHMKEYNNAEIYLKKAQQAAIDYNVTEYNFAITVLFSRLYLSMGDRAYATEHLEQLMEFATRENINLSEYAQDIQEMVNLLLDLEEYEKVLRVIKLLEAVSDENKNIQISMQVMEMYMTYYKAIDDQEAYVRVCVEHAELYKRVREENNQEKILTLNVKIALHESERSAEEAKEKSERDALTGLLNRYAMQKKTTACVEQAKKDKSQVLVGILDIDCFKQYNDTYGHLQGDEVLKHVANVIYDAVHGYGEVFRFGGDEFVILVPNADYKTSEKIAEKICAGIAEKPIENKNSYVMPVLTVSHGYYLATPDEDFTVEQYIDKADTLLYESKKHGRNRYRVKERGK